MLETPFPFFICKKPGEILIFGTFLAKKLIFCQFWSMFTENPILDSGQFWKRHCDVIRRPIFMILVSIERGDPTLYYGTKQSHFGPVNFKFIRGVVTTPLGKPCYKKRLVGRGLIYEDINFFSFLGGGRGGVKDTWAPTQNIEGLSPLAF